MQYYCTIAEYHEEVTARVDRLRGEVVAAMDDALKVRSTRVLVFLIALTDFKVLQPFIGE